SRRPLPAPSSVLGPGRDHRSEQRNLRDPRRRRRRHHHSTVDPATRHPPPRPPHGRTHRLGHPHHRPPTRTAAPTTLHTGDPTGLQRPRHPRRTRRAIRGLQRHRRPPQPRRPRHRTRRPPRLP